MEQQPNTVTATAGGITMTIDLHEMLTAIDPRGSWVGYNPEDDDDVYEPSSLAIQIADRTAAHLVKNMRNEVRDMVQQAVVDRISAEVETIVREHINGTTVQETDEFGFPKGTPAKPLSQMIVEAATKGMHQRDGYGNTPTKMQKLVQEEVTRAFKAELVAEVQAARDAAKKAVQDTAAEVIRETIERASRGL